MPDTPTGATVELEHTRRLSTDARRGSGAGALEELPAEVQALIMDNAREFRAEAIAEEFFTPFTCADAAHITTPTLLISGGATVRMFQLVVDELERCLHPNGWYRASPARRWSDAPRPRPAAVELVNVLR